MLKNGQAVDNQPNPTAKKMGRPPKEITKSELIGAYFEPSDAEIVLTTADASGNRSEWIRKALIEKAKQEGK